jgi:formyl-CoA transferase
LWWKSSGRNKRSISLDLKDTSDRAVLLDLVRHADVLTANFVPGTLERMGLGYDDLRRVNPGLVVLSVSGFGQDGPYRTRRAFGRNAEAYGGLSAVSGYADGAPMPTGFPVADGLSASFGVLGALAVYERPRGGDGQGQHVDVALYETIFRLLAVPALVYDQFATVPGKSSYGTAAGEMVCVARSADGHWMSASRWGAGPVDFAADPTGVAPGTARGPLIDGIARHIAEHNADELLASPGLPYGFAVTAVMSSDEMLDDGRYRARRSLVEVDDPELGVVRLVGVVPRFGRTPGSVTRASPLLDGDREAILREWIGSDGAEHGQGEIT